MGLSAEQALKDWAVDDHDRGCEGRCYSCSCGHDSRGFDVASVAAAEITRLRAENAALRAAGQAVVEADTKWDDPALAVAIDALRAALKEGGGE